MEPIPLAEIEQYLNGLEMLDTKLKGFIIATLRRASYRWKGRTEALKEARLERNTYLCAHCGELFGRKDIQLDHIEPIVDPITGFTTFDNYIARLFIPKEGFQVLCKPDHKIKTDKEKELRKIYRKINKEKS